MNPNDRLPVLITRAWCKSSERGRRRFRSKKQEIAAIQRVASSGLSTMPWPYLQVGQSAQIEAGPLQGMSESSSESSRNEAVLSVQLLQRSIAVEIDRTGFGRPLTTRAAEHRITRRVFDPATC